MILEMHCHTAEHSECSHVHAAEVVQHNYDIGLQGTVLTDHHYLWPPEEIEELRRNLKVPDHYLILSGQEVSAKGWGDVLVFGADRSLEKGTSLGEIRGRFPGAAIVWAHPYRHEKIPRREKLSDPLIHAVEIFSSNHTVAESTRALRDWHELKFTAIAGTDTHALSYAGLYPTLFDHPVSTAAELAGEIRARRCRPFFREVPRSGTSDTVVTEVTVGTGGRGDAPEKFIIKKHRDFRSWHAAEQKSRVMEEIRGRGFGGGRFRLPKPLGNDRESLI
ncbi:MAG TPA: PHP-associated domain-containing protein, partial [Thermodesulfobacteriota bacterium]|nr:PHP-associated domain-containing protein [Thermodesulfobacteriota bacterium]